jgi:acyl-CoA thioesterase-1
MPRWLARLYLAEIMKRLRIVFIVCLSWLPAVGCGPDTPKLPPLGTDARILAFGDSLTYGTGVSKNQSYPAVLQRLTGRKVINAGVPGELSKHGRARLPAVLDRTRPGLLVLIHGGNDLLRQLPRSRVAANVRAMVRMARDRGVAVVLVGVPRPGLLTPVPDLYPRIAADFHLPYLPDVIADIERDPELKSDPIHPNARGYRRLAERINAVLHAAGAL